MFRSLLAFALMASLTAVPLAGRPADDKKSDGDTPVAEGKEFKLNKDEVTVAKESEEDGRYTVTVKAAKAPTAVKMKAQKLVLGFTAADKKDRLEIGSVVVDGPLEGMRTEPKMTNGRGAWQADVGDVITHVNGYAVKTVEELICAVHSAEDPADIQLIIKDVNDGKLYAFYVSAAKK